MDFYVLGQNNNVQQKISRHYIDTHVDGNK
jgi:hypothetical protein